MELFAVANVCFSNRVSFSSSVFPSFVVITAWVTLLYMAGLSGGCRLPQALVGSGWRASLLGRRKESALGQKQS